MNKERAISARKAIRDYLEFTRSQSYRIKGKAWKQITASLAFETPANLSLIQYLDDEQEQERFLMITQGEMDGILSIGDVINLYLKFFTRPQSWRDFEELLSREDNG